MKRIVFATSLLAGCTQNADIGIDDQPVSCMPNNAAAAEVRGTVSAGSQSVTFGDTTVMKYYMPLRLFLETPAMSPTVEPSVMHLSFLCGPPTVDTYGVEPVEPQTIDCPLSVAADFGGAAGATGQIYADASGGKLIVDETVNCLAGRFDIKFDNPTNANGGPGSNGELAGWFSVPWQ